MKPRTKTFRVECLEQRQVLSATVAEVEPNNLRSEANVVEVSTLDTTSIIGNSVTRNDDDYFHFTPTESGTLTLDISSLEGARSKVVFRAGAGQGAKLLKTTFEGDTPLSESFHVDAGETYELRYKNRDRGVEAPYQIDLSIVADPEPGNEFLETENNNSRKIADRFELGDDGVAGLSGESVNKKDKDFFAFVAQQSGALNLRVEANGADVQLKVQDSAGNKIFETHPNDGVNEGTVEVVEGETYYLRLRSTSKTDAGQYLVALNLGDAAVSAAGGSTAGSDDGTADQGSGDAGGSTAGDDDGTAD
ncbi:MAG: hypothetical protein KDA42_07035, partial [Planctomycetales bacterium]|nr:hypothetical protein [Planctomycetales bacterium]